MHNLIKSRAVFEILKKPLPELLRFYRDSESESDCEDSSVDATTTAISDVAVSALVTNVETEPDADEDAEADAEAAAAKLNVNAIVFVPRSKNWKNNNSSAEEMRLSELQHQFESLDERKPTQPKLMLPWKGFPKPIQTEHPTKAPVAAPVVPALPTNPNKEMKLTLASNVPKIDMQLKHAQPPDKERKKPVKERALTKSVVPDEKRREQERKVALEALKLVQQRRMREPLEPQIIVHLTRSPVDFTPEERVRVNRLRIIKREHIESVLREMRQELELKQQKSEGPQLNSRYICLQRTVKVAKMESPCLAQDQVQDQASPEKQLKQPKEPKEPKDPKDPKEPKKQASCGLGPPKRYIPTVKQWDERCKAKANKENNVVGKPLSKPEESIPPQRAMVPSSQCNIMAPAVAMANCKPLERELFVPRYWPPAPLVVRGEGRRGNLTHARNITRAFANCGLLPTPTSTWDVSPQQIYELPQDTKPVRRYGMEELLQLEPQPHALQKPLLDEALYKLAFICE